MLFKMDVALSMQRQLDVPDETPTPIRRFKVICTEVLPRKLLFGAPDCAVPAVDENGTPLAPKLKSPQILRYFEQYGAQ